jgi:hypothetical protein
MPPPNRLLQDILRSLLRTFIVAPYISQISGRPAEKGYLDPRGTPDPPCIVLSIHQHSPESTVSQVSAITDSTCVAETYRDCVCGSVMGTNIEKNLNGAKGFSEFLFDTLDI